ncbi:MAG: hypothetical protein QF915_01050 [Candidatus Woesearchaeota archaeon]|nr:hypothetical protein [Candidatus Woesearchaeota archaeon]
MLDSNEFIFYLLENDKQIDRIIHNEDFCIYVNEQIVKEVLRNIPRQLRSKFYHLLMKSNIFLDTELCSKEVFAKYKNLGFKKGDILIAGFCEMVEAKFLISENRHFLKQRVEPFTIVDKDEFCKKFF